MDTFSRLQSMALSANDRHLISLKPSRILNKDMMYKETWLSNAETVSAGPCCSQWSRQHSQEILIQGMQRCMRQCLQT
jgi:hypothetical protein